MIQKKEQSAWLIALLACSLFFSFIAFTSYLTIDSQSYFFQDDFYFWPRYATIDFRTLFNPASNFGRPVTRDLYFFLTAHLFGSDSSNYFYLNLAIIAGVCWFIYRTLREFSIAPYVAAAAAAVYAYMAPTVPHASWISNSQHTVAHLFSFWFIASIVGSINADKPRLLRAAALYLLAVFSNVSSLFALVFVGVFVLLRNHRAPVKQFGRVIAILFVLGAITVAWSLVISHHAPVVYKIDLSIEHSITGAKFYDDFLRAGLLGHGYWPLFVVMLALTLFNLRRNYLLVLPLAAAFATAFGMLFFLSDQRTLGYMAIPYILFALMLFSNFAASTFQPSEIRSRVLIVLSFIFVFYSIEVGAPQRDSFIASPYGAGIRELQATVRDIPVHGDTTFCFAPDMAATKGGPTEFWLFLGSGRALWLVDYSDNYKRQFLYYTDPECSKPDVVHVSVIQKNSMVKVSHIDIPN